MVAATMVEVLFMVDAVLVELDVGRVQVVVRSDQPEASLRKINSSPSDYVRFGVGNRSNQRPTVTFR